MPSKLVRPGGCVGLRPRKQVVGRPIGAAGVPAHSFPGRVHRREPARGLLGCCQPRHRSPGPGQPPPSSPTHLPPTRPPHRADALLSPVTVPAWLNPRPPLPAGSAATAVAAARGQVWPRRLRAARLVGLLRRAQHKLVAARADTNSGAWRRQLHGLEPFRVQPTLIDVHVPSAVMGDDPCPAHPVGDRMGGDVVTERLTVGHGSAVVGAGRRCRSHRAPAAAVNRSGRGRGSAAGRVATWAGPVVCARRARSIRKAV